MTRGVLSVYSSSNVARATALMANRNIGSVVVMGSEGPIGIFTERDLLSKVLAAHLSLQDTPITKVMSSVVARIDEEQSTQQAAKVMLSTKSRLLVFEEADLVGIVTATDLAKAIQRLGIRFDISNVISRKIVTVAETAPVAAVIRDMAQKRIGSVIVTRKAAPHGIFTERDLLKIFDEDLEKIAIGEAASTHLTTAQLGIDGGDVADILVSKKVRRLPLMQNDRVVAMVTARDLVEAFASTNLEVAKELAKQTRVRYGELCPICNSRIDDSGLCACGAGSG
jgi:CBS domain-containing protein